MKNKKLLETQEYLKNFNNTIKTTLNIPEGVELQIKNSVRGYCVLMSMSDDPSSIFCGTEQQIKQFLIHVIKIAYIRDEYKQDKE